MNWSTFYLVCFAVGLVLSLFSLAGGLGKFRLTVRSHFPHFLGHSSAHGLPVHVHSALAPVTARPIGPRMRTSTRGSQVSFFNFSSLMAFLAWFGGTGYLLTRYSNAWTALAFAIALASGLAAAAMVFIFLAKVLLAHETSLDPADFDLIGVLGKVNSAIHAGGTGEIVFTQGGTRHVAGARSEDANAIPKGAEVVITRYERGIAYVRRWEDMMREDGLPSPETEHVL